MLRQTRDSVSLAGHSSNSLLFPNDKEKVKLTGSHKWLMSEGGVPPRHTCQPQATPVGRCFHINEFLLIYYDEM